MPELLVNKPQFDTTKLATGKAVFVTGTGDRNAFYNFAAACLITVARPLELTLCYFKAGKTYGDDEDEDGDTGMVSIAYKTLPVKLVADGLVKIELLERKVTNT